MGGWVGGRLEDLDSGGAAAGGAYIDGRRRAGAKGICERDRRMGGEGDEREERPRGAWGGWARCVAVADSSRRAPSPAREARGRTSSHAHFAPGGRIAKTHLINRGLELPLPTALPLPTRPPRFPDFAPRPPAAATLKSEHLHRRPCISSEIYGAVPFSVSSI